MTIARASSLLIFGALVSGCASSGADPSSGAAGPAGPRIVQPGAPGQATRPFAGAPLEEIEGADYTDADVRFMRGMIHHHAQALQMAALIPDRTSDRTMNQMAMRIEISQRDEIAMMQRWLLDRGLDAPDGDPNSGTPLMRMPGMLSPDQMRTLRESEGVEFERYFLQFMIQHHGGAIVMVQELFGTPGAGQESTINFFANEVDSDQTIEVQRMQQMLRARR